MIPVVPPPEPQEFDKRVRQPGLAWLVTNPTKTTLRPYWTEWGDCIIRLATGFQYLCAYTAMYIPCEGATIDHFISQSTDRFQAYEWSNHRYAAFRINSSKNASNQFLDPFKIQDGWFEVILPSLLIGSGMSVKFRIWTTNVKVENGTKPKRYKAY